MDLDRPPDIVVVAGGEPVAPALVAVVAPGTRVVAADAGVDLARHLGWDVTVAVGDFDSITAAARSGLAADGVDVRRHPTDKDATDLELALEVADELADEAAPCRVLVLGLEGGRPDHALANLLVASAPRFTGLDVELVLARGRAWVVRDELRGALPAGRLLSIVPVHGPATVSASGVRWPLDHAVLPAGTTRGVSNMAIGGPLAVAVHDGTALCIAPHPEENR
ncbi:MAG: thiamine diphosphokinase [Acidimicrobiia bacterium]